jgi:hypothetical protein
MDQQLLVPWPDGNFCCKHITHGMTALAGLATAATGVGALSGPARQRSGLSRQLSRLPLSGTHGNVNKKGKIDEVSN